MKYEWTEEKLAGKGHEFLNAVIDNMGKHPNTVVRFGTKGEGDMPNYQVDKMLDICGKVIEVVEKYQSRSHKLLKTKGDTLNPDNLSRAFTLAEMKALARVG